MQCTVGSVKDCSYPQETKPNEYGLHAWSEFQVGEGRMFLWSIAKFSFLPSEGLLLYDESYLPLHWLLQS